MATCGIHNLIVRRNNRERSHLGVDGSGGLPLSSLVAARGAPSHAKPSSSSAKRKDSKPDSNGRGSVDFDALKLSDKVVVVALESMVQGLTSGLLGGFAGLVYGGVSQRTFAAARAEGRKFLTTWGLFGMGYNLGLGLARSIRGKQDKYNAVFAACTSGALFSREQGPKGMLTGCVQFAGFTYLIETFLIDPQQGRQQEQGMETGTIEIPVSGKR